MKRIAAGAVAEFIGAGALTLIGAAAIMHGHGIVSVALAHGLILAVGVTAAIHLSGGQFNPAVSIALAAIKKQSWGQAIVFTLAQLVGAVAAAALLNAIPAANFAGYEGARLGATLGSLSDGPNQNIPLLFGLETLATFLLMFVILGAGIDPRGVGRVQVGSGFAIGLTVAALIFCFGPLTGASMNPSRSFGPALIGGFWAAHWVYWVAPILGAFLAAMLWNTILGGRTAVPPPPVPELG